MKIQTYFDIVKYLDTLTDLSGNVVLHISSSKTYKVIDIVNHLKKTKPDIKNVSIIADTIQRNCGCIDINSLLKYAADFCLVFKENTCCTELDNFRFKNLPKVKIYTQAQENDKRYENITCNYNKVMNFNNAIELNLENICVGIVMTTTLSTLFIKLRDRYIKQLKKYNVKHIMIFLNALKPEKLDNFTGVTHWLILTCRYSLINHKDYRLPLLNPLEFEVSMLGKKSYQPEISRLSDVLLLNDTEEEEYTENDDANALSMYDKDWTLSMPIPLIPSHTINECSTVKYHANSDFSPILMGRDGIASDYSKLN